MQVLEKILEEILQYRKDNNVYAGKQVLAIEDIIRRHMDDGKDTDVPTNNGWIPCSERLPEDLEKVLVWYEYFRYGEYNCMFETCGIGWQLDGYWSGDVSGTKARCIAWMPLPDPYKQEEPKPAKNTQQEMEDFWNDK